MMPSQGRTHTVTAEASRTLPVVVIGAGPVGLAAAAHLVRRGAEPLVLEAAASVGANVLRWAHVRMFSPWRYSVDPVATALLEATGWTPPLLDDYPTGRDLVDRYLAPLAAVPALRSRIELGTRVLDISRLGLDRTKSKGRELAPFVLRVARANGEALVLARAIIDASGTVGTPNPVGGSGLPALGEAQAADRLAYGVPDVLGRDRRRYAGRRTLVVGSGHSAFNVLADLVVLAEQVPGTHVRWVIRRTEIGNLFGGGEADQLPERGRLGLRLRALVESGRVPLTFGIRITRILATPDGLVAASDDETLPPVDEVVVAAGFRPDLSMLREMRLDLDSVIESPSALAPVIDPNLHSCGTVPPHGEDVLRHPEPGFYLAGMKSYGRAPNFLMLTGYEQVRSIVCALTGDADGARRVELTLPATGVCSGSGPAVDVAAGCCGPAVDERSDTAGSDASRTTSDAPEDGSASSSCCAPAPVPVVLRLGRPMPP